MGSRYFQFGEKRATSSDEIGTNRGSPEVEPLRAVRSPAAKSDVSDGWLDSYLVQAQYRLEGSGSSLRDSIESILILDRTFLAEEP